MFCLTLSQGSSLLAFLHLQTYNVDRQVSDSAGTATAIMTGVKVNLGTLGVTSDVPFAKSCDGYSEIFNLKSVLDYALEASKFYMEENRLFENVYFFYGRR